MTIAIVIPLRRHRGARGYSLLELTVVLAILGGVFVGIMNFMNVVAGDLHSESIEADQQTRASGQMHDILTEVRQATAQSPNFAILNDAVNPPSFTFDLPSTTSSIGAVVWGSRITYRLVANPGRYLDRAGTIQDATILRDETPAGGGSTMTSAIEQGVPYRITEGGVTYWGFSVSINANAVTLTIRKTGDTGVALRTTVQSTRSTQGTLATAIYTGTYFLRNSQVALPLP